MVAMIIKLRVIDERFNSVVESFMSDVWNDLSGDDSNIESQVTSRFYKFINGKEDSEYLKDTTEIKVVSRMCDKDEGKRAWYALEHSKQVVNQ